MTPCLVPHSLLIYLTNVINFVANMAQIKKYLGMYTQLPSILKRASVVGAILKTVF